MSFNSKLWATVLAATFAVPAFAEGLMIKDAYARSAFDGAKTGAAFMQIMNHANEEDRLIAVRSDVAQKVQLHTHEDMGEGVMKMMHVPEGFAIPAGGTRALSRGGDHVMLMGLTRKLIDGGAIEMTLVFDKAGEIVVQIPVDRERQDHGVVTHGDMDHSEGSAGK